MNRSPLKFGLIFIAGMFSGGFVAVSMTSQAADTPPSAGVPAAVPVQAGGLVIQTGVVSDGEQVPVPSDADTAAIHIFLSIRELQDNNEILGRTECFLESDGRTARVRNVNKFTGETVSAGHANFILLYAHQ